MQNHGKLQAQSLMPATVLWPIALEKAGVKGKRDYRRRTLTKGLQLLVIIFSRAAARAEENPYFSCLHP
jgi:hypothetical protein